MQKPDNAKPVNGVFFCAIECTSIKID
jgi:hypothetical protein